MTSQLTLVKDQSFKDETVNLDGKRFEVCSFVNCNLEYSGGPIPEIIECKLDEVFWQYSGAAERTLAWLRMSLNEDPRRTLLFEQLLGEPEIVDRSRPSDEEINKGHVEFDFLEGDPLHAQCVAQIAAMFAALEVILCQIFAWAIHCAPHHAAAAFYQLVNNKARIDMIRGLSVVLHTDQERVGLRNILDKVTEVAIIRNRYCHALWQKKRGRVYVTENFDTHYPRGTKRQVSAETILAETATCKKLLNEVRAELTSLTQIRPLTVSTKAIKPSFAQKFLQPRGRGSESGDPKLPSNNEGTEPPPESSQD